MLQRFAFICLICGIVAAQKTLVEQPKYRVGVGFAESRALYSPDPTYTKEALALGIKGTVVVAVRVDEKGCVREPKVTRSLGYGLDEEALKVLRYWRVRPSIKSGRPVSVKMTIELNFTPDYPPINLVKATDKPCGE